MKHLFTTTALGLMLAAAPALAQTTTPTQTPSSPPSAQQTPSDMNKSPDGSTQSPGMTQSPSTMSPSGSTATLPSRGDSAQFITAQKQGDWLATDLIGQRVMNASNESIGDVNDLVSDNSGKVVAVLIGVGGFLGIGEKEVAVKYEYLQITTDANGNIKVMLNADKKALESAPDYQTLGEAESAKMKQDRANQQPGGQMGNRPAPGAGTTTQPKSQ